MYVGENWKTMKFNLISDFNWFITVRVVYYSTCSKSIQWTQYNRPIHILHVLHIELHYINSYMHFVYFNEAIYLWKRVFLLVVSERATLSVRLLDSMMSSRIQEDTFNILSETILPSEKTLQKFSLGCNKGLLIKKASLVQFFKTNSQCR